jgi:predicted kinase
MIYLLCGLPGSGKSTWAKKKAKETEALIINKDQIRTMLFGEYGYRPEVEDIVRKITHGSILAVKSSKRDVIIDECNITKEKRSEVMMYTETTPTVCVYFTEKENNLKNRMHDRRGIPMEQWESIIMNMSESFEEPTIDEGFISIEEVSID